MYLERNKFLSQLINSVWLHQVPWSEWQLFLVTVCRGTVILLPVQARHFIACLSCYQRVDALNYITDKMHGITPLFCKYRILRSPPTNS